tara:strand:+ start:246 stop:449 length:204 start_codon:yes stop_codon:yes gene_type:complete
MDQINDFDEYIVVWSDNNSTGGRIYDPFKSQKDAYDYMIAKLSEGNWACMSPKDKLPKIHYAYGRRR